MKTKFEAAKTKAKVAFWIVVALVGLVIIWPLLFPFVTSDTVIITVTDKERIIQDDGTPKYLIFTESEVFENTDCKIRFKFDSSTFYGKIIKGETYEAKVYGFRVPIFSMYRNILKVEKQ